MSVQLSSSAYQIMGAPMLSLFYKPLSYVTPYVQAVDDFGDQTLSKVEEKFPVVKKPSPELIKEAKEAVYAPVQQVTSLYSLAYQRAEGGYAVASGKAAAKTAVFVWLASTCYLLKEGVKYTGDLTPDGSFNERLDKLKAAFYHQLFEPRTADANHVDNGEAAETEDQDAFGAKTSSD
jgi:hypothetical protein